MDKIIRNVIIFAAVILVVAAGFTVFVVSRNNSSVNNNANNIVTSQVATTATGEVQDATLSVVGGTYVITPSVFKKGIPVRMTADMATLKGCSRSVVIASFGVRKTLTGTDNVIIFTPTQTGTINIACSMNMYRGTFTVE
jgi:plastocyanin domain-containing protein